MAETESNGRFVAGMTPWNKGKKYLQIEGENHPLWKGDRVGYGALHAWVYRKLGRKNICDICGTIEAKRYHWANVSGEYKREISDWVRKCARCHVMEHKNWERLDKKRHSIIMKKWWKKRKEMALWHVA